MTAPDLGPSPIPEGSVIITPSQMYAEIRAMHASVEKLANTVDPALSDIRSDVRDHETRIRGIERRMWQVAGAVALIAGGGAAAATKILGG
jgi:hypothetical protein